MQRSTILVAVAVILVAFLFYRNKAKASPGGKKWTVYGTKGCGWTVKQLEYMKKTEEKECEIKEIQMRKHNFCKSVGGHNFREEIEGGLYGERYKVCATCGLEV